MVCFFFITSVFLSPIVNGDLKRLQIVMIKCSTRSLLHWERRRRGCTKWPELFHENYIFCEIFSHAWNCSYHYYMRILFHSKLNKTHFLNIIYWPFSLKFPPSSSCIYQDRLLALHFFNASLKLHSCSVVNTLLFLM